MMNNQIEKAVIGGAIVPPSTKDELRKLNEQIEELIFAVQTLTEVIAEKN